MKRLLSRKGAAEYLDISQRRLDELTRVGALAAKRDGRSVKYDITELDRYASDLHDWEPRSVDS
jgi:excisionase family DNA binding protein